MDCCCRTNWIICWWGGGHVDFADGPNPDNGGAGGGGHGQNPQNATGETPGVYGTGGWRWSPVAADNLVVLVLSLFGIQNHKYLKKL